MLYACSSYQAWCERDWGLVVTTVITFPQSVLGTPFLLAPLAYPHQLVLRQQIDTQVANHSLIYCSAKPNSLYFFIARKSIEISPLIIFLCALSVLLMLLFLLLLRHHLSGNSEHGVLSATKPITLQSACVGA